MTLQLPRPGQTYDQVNEAKAREGIEQADLANQKRGTNYDIGTNGKFILTSPNGNRWNVTVSNAGALVVSAL